MDEDWLGQFRVSDFTRTVWRYAHVFTAHEIVGKKFLKLAGIDLRQIDDIPRLYIFWPGGDVDDYGPEDVTNCSFGRFKITVTHLTRSLQRSSSAWTAWQKSTLRLHLPPTPN